MTQNGSGDSSAMGAQAAAQGPSLIGHVLDGRYRITRKIGEGGMGEVWAAEHVHIEKRFAIKLLRPEIVSNAEAVTRFRQEARSASSIGHRNIIEIEDFGQLPDGRIYMCMELLNGEPLNDMLKQPLPADRLLNIMIQTGHGLAAAHAKGIVHRDMKPENIFVTIGPNNEDVPKLLDFGIAKVAGGDGQNHLTRTGTIFGTPYYMAPEQALGNPVDARTDIYAMGVILYEVFAGSVPFGGESFMGILTQHITVDPEPVVARASKLGRALPAGLAEVIGYCMQKNPAERYQTMDTLVGDLVAIYRALAGAGMSSYMHAFPGAPALTPGSGLYVATGASAGGMLPQASLASAGGMLPQASLAAAARPLSPQAFVPPSSGTTGDFSRSQTELPAGSRRGLLWGALLALVLAGGGGAAWYFLLGPGAAKPQPAAPAAVVVVPPDAPVPVKPVDAAPPSVDAAVEAPKVDALPPANVEVTTKVLISSNVPKFEIFDGAAKVADGPDNVDVAEQGSRTLTLRARGYKDKVVEISAAQPKWVIKLEREEKNERDKGKGGKPGSDPEIPQPTTEPPPASAADPKPESCASKILRPDDAACVRQFCATHPAAPVCMLD